MYDRTAGGDTPPQGGPALAALLDAGRRDRGLTHETLAVKSGLGERTVSRYLAGKVVAPRPKQLRAICAATGVPPADALVALGYLPHHALVAA